MAKKHYQRLLMNSTQNYQQTPSCSLVIGRFQMFHEGHNFLLQSAFNENPFVICAIGSSFQAPDVKNPFSFHMRSQLILSTLTDEQKQRIFFCAIPDLYDDRAWNQTLATQVNIITNHIQNSFENGIFNPTLTEHSFSPFFPELATDISADERFTSFQKNLTQQLIDTHLLELQQLFNPPIPLIENFVTTVNNQKNTSTIPTIPVTLVGFKKDHSSYYLDNFPQFLFKEILPYTKNSPSIENEQHVFNATDIRNNFFSNPQFFDIFDQLHLPSQTKPILKQFSQSKLFERLQQEYFAIIEYKKKYTQPIAYTADALIEHRGDVLLIERGGQFGNKLLALPGGFCEPNETPYQSALRELQEETSIDLCTIKHSLVNTMCANHPERSRRMHISSTVHHFVIDEQSVRPQALAQDDAQRFFWVPKEFLPNCAPYLFEDHYSICAKLLNLEPFCAFDFKPTLDAQPKNSKPKI